VVYALAKTLHKKSLPLLWGFASTIFPKWKKELAPSVSIWPSVLGKYIKFRIRCFCREISAFAHHRFSTGLWAAGVYGQSGRGKELFMLKDIKVSLSRQEIIGAVKSMKKRDREDFLEELLATTSPEYLKSIKDARADYKTGRVKKHDEVFGR
jgi:hypothetical protein